MEGTEENLDQDVAKKLETLRLTVELPTEKLALEASEVEPVPQSRDMERLIDKSQVQEQPFSSTAPIIGPLIAWIRQAWNNISTTWYVRSLVQQQNEFNTLVVRQLKTIEMLDEELDSRLIYSDRDSTRLAHRVAELTYAVTRVEQRLARIEGHLEGHPSEQS
jgi:hypothetical protein